MKVTVTKAFVDKHTHNKFLEGSEYEGSESRIDELVKAGCAEKPKTQKAETEAAEPSKTRRARRKKE